MDSTKKYKYKLEKHLKNLCENNIEYRNLYSSWELNKTTYKDILSNIQISYPHYSLHDSTHSETIITNIEMVLGEERIQKLSPTDTWLLLNCAYLHDFGMVLLYSDIESEWKSDDFKNYLKTLKNSSDNDLKKAVCYIENLKNNLNKDDFESIWPLKIKNYVVQIIESYYRKKHSNLSKEYLRKLDEWNLDLTQNGLINNRFIILIGEISALHTKNFEEIMKLDYISNGYNADYIHPRFIAVMIRLGDLLDLDNGRFNECTEKVVGDFPIESKIHKEKHKAIIHFLVNKESIELRADCPNDDVYRELRKWVTWIDDEIKNILLNIKEIYPDNLECSIPKLKKVDLLIQGNEDLESKADLKFRISQEKAFEVIEGSNIYENKITFIREFVQNALDASKIQLWEDLNRGIYDPWLKEKLGNNINYEKLTPFDLYKCKIFDNYEINIYVNNLENNEVKVIIQDKGIGISIENLKKMCSVGESYYEKKEIYDNSFMPLWLRPTGGFGIGMQSGFLVNDKFTAYTKYDSNPVMQIDFEPATKGYITVRKSEEDIKIGTKMEINVPEIKNFKYSLGGHVDNFINYHYDEFNENNLTFYSILDYIDSNINDTFFPIKVYVNGEQSKRINQFEKINFDYEECNDKYLYYFLGESEMVIWDKKNSIYFRIDIEKYIKNIGFTITRVNTFFKGCSVEKDLILNNIKGFYIMADIYGFDTKKSIQLNRQELKVEGKRKLNDAIQNMIDFYLKKIKERIDKRLNQENYEKMNLFELIILSSKYLKSFQSKNYENLLNYIKIEIILFEKNENNYEKKSVSFDNFYKDICENFPWNIKYINIEKFKKRIDGIEQVDYKEIEELLNNSNDLNYDYIIADEDFIKIIKDFCIAEIKYIENETPLFIYRIRNNKDEWKVKVDSKTKKYIISKLAYEENKRKYYRPGESDMRCYIPAIEEYSSLAVKWVSPRISGDFYNTTKIISPITKEDATSISIESNETLTEEEFVKGILIREDYNRLVNFTKDNQIEDISKDEINNKYIELIKEYYKIITEN